MRHALRLADSAEDHAALNCAAAATAVSSEFLPTTSVRRGRTMPVPCRGGSSVQTAGVRPSKAVLKSSPPPRLRPSLQPPTATLSPSLRRYQHPATVRAFKNSSFTPDGYVPYTVPDPMCKNLGLGIYYVIIPLPTVGGIKR